MILPKKVLFFVFIFCGSLFRSELPAESFVQHGHHTAVTSKPEIVSPWLTGPLLTPSGHVVPEGAWNIEPYFYATAITGTYDKHWKARSRPNFYSLLGQFPLQYGFAEDWDFQFVPQVLWNDTKGASSWALGDVPILFDWQILDSKEVRWPTLRIAFKLNLPTGKYQKLNRSKLGTDVGGSGNLSPTIAFVSSQLIHFGGNHFLSTRYYLGCTATVPVHVKGLSVYGGGSGTKGKAFPGVQYIGLVGLEYTLTQRWALAFDIQYLHANRTRFAGKTIKPVGYPSSEQLSFAPGIEYNWSSLLGIIGGVWFTAAGRNSPQFASGIIAVNIYK